MRDLYHSVNVYRIKETDFPACWDAHRRKRFIKGKIPGAKAPINHYFVITCKRSACYKKYNVHRSQRLLACGLHPTASRGSRAQLLHIIIFRNENDTAQSRFATAQA
jgi:hypothetical protein